MTAVTRATAVDVTAFWDVVAGIAVFLSVICGGGVATRLLRGGS